MRLYHTTMKHLAISLFALLLFTGTALAQGGAVSGKYLDGTWKVVKAVYDGEELEVDKVKMQWEFSYAGRVVLHQGDGETIATWNTVSWHTNLIEINYTDGKKETYYVHILSDDKMELSLMGDSVTLEVVLTREK